MRCSQASRKVVTTSAALAAGAAAEGGGGTLTIPEALNDQQLRAALQEHEAVRILHFTDPRKAFARFASPSETIRFKVRPHAHADDRKP